MNESQNENINNQQGVEENKTINQEWAMTADSTSENDVNENAALQTSLMGSKILVKMSVESIVIPQNHRKTDEKVIESIAKSIKDSGLIYPPIISSDNYLIAGHHRIGGLKKLGIKEAEFIQLAYNYDSDECRLITLTENVERKELTRMEKAFAIVKMQQLLKKLRPDVKPTTNMSREKQIIIADKKIAKQVMGQLKIQKSEYYELLGIAKSIVPEAREYLSTLNVNDDFKVAIDLANLSAGQQLELLKPNPTKAEFIKELKEITARNSKELNQKTDKVTATKQEKEEQQEIEVDGLIERLKEEGLSIKYAELDRTFELRLPNNCLLQECDNMVQLIWFLKGMLRIIENKKLA